MSSYDAALIDWATIDDPRLLGLPRGVRLLHLEAIVWSRLHRTDGEVPRAVLLAHRVSDEPEPEKAANALTRAGLWQRSDDGWSIAGFLASQMSREQVERKRAQARDRYDRWQSGDDKPQRVGKRVGKRVDKRVGKRVDNGVANDTDPTRPEPKGREGKGTRSRAASAGATAGARADEQHGLGKRALNTKQRTILTEMFEGERCWTCTAEFAEGELALRSHSHKAGAMLPEEARRHRDWRTDCQPQPDGYEMCTECWGLFPAGALAQMDPDEPNGELHCPKGFGCGGPTCHVCGLYVTPAKAVWDKEKGLSHPTCDQAQRDEVPE